MCVKDEGTLKKLHLQNPFTSEQKLTSQHLGFLPEKAKTRCTYERNQEPSVSCGSSEPEEEVGGGYGAPWCCHGVQTPHTRPRGFLAMSLCAADCLGESGQ